jgi:ribonucleoside-diphosphate reductase alpha chain
MFIKEWASLIESKSGERGIFSRVACNRSLPDRREADHEWGTNPCSEIVLRPRQFCNLTEVIARPGDTEDSLLKKVELATILGTIQSTYTNFRYLGKRWRDNCEEERLLGVSITGIMDCGLLNHDGCGDVLDTLRLHAIDTNKKWAKKLGINPSSAITCVKPSGTVSQLVGSSSGIHPRYAPYYIRRVRNDIKDPLSQALIDNGVPYEIDVTNSSVYVFEFPIESPVHMGGTTEDDGGAINQLNKWLLYDKHWCEHKPSVSIYVKEEEWLDVGAWVYKNFDQMSGVSFFPKDDHVYQQPPYEEMDVSEYTIRNKAMPTTIDFDSIVEYEDTTTASQELACTGGQCEL